MTAPPSHAPPTGGVVPPAPAIQTHFTDFFGVAPALLDEYGAFNVSLVNDLPLFIDPFLLFNSSEAHYQELHDRVIRYVRFLRDKAMAGGLTVGALHAWFCFPEVRQTWLGYSLVGNGGSGLGMKFARALGSNLQTIFTDFGAPGVTKGSHVEKLTLISSGVGRDNISDFTTNLIKEFLCEYTQTFAQHHLPPELRRVVAVEKVRFNYDTESWETRRYELPFVNGDYVLLTPTDTLTKDETWINRPDLFRNYEEVAESIPDEALRAQINAYLLKKLPAKEDPDEEPNQKELHEAILEVLREFPVLLEHYIRYKEDHGDEAVAVSDMKVSESRQLYVEQVKQLIRLLLGLTPFYEVAGSSLDAARARVMYFKAVIEDRDGWRVFYVDGKPVKRENDLQLLYRLTWYGTRFDVNREVNNGRGPVDYAVSEGSRDKSLVEFKLASNTQLKKNLEHQVGIYEKAGDAQASLKVILFFNDSELAKVRRTLKELQLENDPNIILIDARRDNKPSASKADGSATAVVRPPFHGQGQAARG